MMHHKVIRALCNLTLANAALGKLGIGAVSVRTMSVALVGGAVALACAGGDTPARDDDLENAIAQAYANGVGVSGSGPAPSGGSGGRAPTGGTGGRVSQGGSNATSGAGGAPAAGTGGTAPEGGSGGSGSEECNGFAILQLKCNGPSCHGDGSTVSGFAASEAAAMGFIDQDPSSSGQCVGNDPIMDPGNPGNSLIIQKLEGTPCGLKMPLGAPLSDDEVQCIEDWIGTL